MAGLCKRAGIAPLAIRRRKVKNKKGQIKIKEFGLYYGFHSIRHFISSYLFDKKKVGKATIGKILGHQSSSTTDIYLHSLDESMRGAMQNLEGAFWDSKEASSGSGSSSGSETHQEAANVAVLPIEIIKNTA